jgi:hypothetical protein
LGKIYTSRSLGVRRSVDTGRDGRRARGFRSIRFVLAVPRGPVSEDVYSSEGMHGVLLIGGVQKRRSIRLMEVDVRAAEVV